MVRKKRKKERKKDSKYTRKQSYLSCTQVTLEGKNCNLETAKFRKIEKIAKNH